jgi:hypothetical protein
VAPRPRGSTRHRVRWTRVPPRGPRSSSMPHCSAHDVTSTPCAGRTPAPARSGWMPAVEGGWRKGRSASDTRHLPLTPEVLAAHLTGDVHIGLFRCLPATRLRPSRSVRRPSPSASGQANSRGARLPRRRGARPRCRSHEAGARLHQPRIPRPPQAHVSATQGQEQRPTLRPRQDEIGVLVRYLPGRARCVSPDQAAHFGYGGVRGTSAK